ncbi:MAG: hypothetical protein K0S04_2122 [Herbinix sp.]|jgi:uncharacterized membrane protein|nr:hypothetical protein [Herbinix sp.]
MENKKVKLKRTKLHIFLEVISFLILIAMFFSLYLNWSSIPEQIPGHYNALGEIDRWGNKSELLVLPVLSIFLYLLLTVICFFPAIWNLPTEVTDRNREFVYSNTLTMMILLKAVVLAIFFYLNLNSMQAKNLSVYFLPVMLFLVFGILIFFVVRIIRISKRLG